MKVRIFDEGGKQKVVFEPDVIRVEKPQIAETYVIPKEKYLQIQLANKPQSVVYDKDAYDKAVKIQNFTNSNVWANGLDRRPTYYNPSTPKAQAAIQSNFDYGKLQVENLGWSLLPVAKVPGKAMYSFAKNIIKSFRPVTSRLTTFEALLPYQIGEGAEAVVFRNSPSTVGKVMFYSPKEETLARNKVPTFEKISYKGDVNYDGDYFPVYEQRTLRMPTAEEYPKYEAQLIDEILKSGWRQVEDPANNLVFTNGKMYITDIARENVGITKKGKPKLIDVGLLSPEDYFDYIYKNGGTLKMKNTTQHVCPIPISQTIFRSSVSISPISFYQRGGLIPKGQKGIKLAEAILKLYKEGSAKLPAKLSKLSAKGKQAVKDLRSGKISGVEFEKLLDVNDQTLIRSTYSAEEARAIRTADNKAALREKKAKYENRKKSAITQQQPKPETPTGKTPKPETPTGETPKPTTETKPTTEQSSEPQVDDNVVDINGETKIVGENAQGESIIKPETPTGETPKLTTETKDLESKIRELEGNIEQYRTKVERVESELSEANSRYNKLDTKYERLLNTQGTTPAQPEATPAQPEATLAQNTSSASRKPSHSFGSTLYGRSWKNHPWRMGVAHGIGVTALTTDPVQYVLGGISNFLWKPKQQPTDTVFLPEQLTSPPTRTDTIYTAPPITPTDSIDVSKYNNDNFYSDLGDFN